MTAKRLELVKKLLAALERNYGRATVLADAAPLDQVVYHIIEAASGKKAAESGLGRLRKAFVDWNEVRVSSDREIAACLTDVRREDRPGIAANVKAGLEHLFDVRYRDEFDLTETGEDHDAALEHLAELEGLDHGRAALVLFGIRPAPTPFLPFTSIGRILMRVGAVRKTTSARAVVESVTELVDEKDLGRLTYLLSRHGHELCGVKSYYCTQCKAALFCSMGQRRIRNTRAGRRKATTAGSSSARTRSRSPARKK
jgi:endonuclease III